MMFAVYVSLQSMQLQTYVCQMWNAVMFAGAVLILTIEISGFWTSQQICNDLTMWASKKWKMTAPLMQNLRVWWRGGDHVLETTFWKVSDCTIVGSVHALIRVLKHGKCWFIYSGWWGMQSMISVPHAAELEFRYGWWIRGVIFCNRGKQNCNSIK